jgi:glycosyltransferase involved in cell wall biosynthesis
MSKNLRTSVIICCYTTERLNDIREAIDSVLNQTLKPHEVIIAVDHNEELFDILKAELPNNVKVILSDGAPGISDTRNAGIRFATGDIIACIDDDGVAEEPWLENLVRPFEDSNVMVVGGHSIPLWSGQAPKWFPEELYWVVGGTYKGMPVEGNEMRNIWGGNTAFRKEVFNKAGLFKIEVGRYGKIQGVAEEADICIRIKHYLPEARIIYEPKAVTHHKVPSWRVNRRYLIQRSYNEGFYKSIVERLSPDPILKTLSTENAYLRYLLFTSIPQRIRYFYKSGNLGQMCAIMISIVATVFGYLKGKLGFK